LQDNESSAPTFNWLQWLGGASYEYVYALSVNGDEIYAGGPSNNATSWETPTYTGGSFGGGYESFVAELQDNASAAPTFNWLQWLGSITGVNDYIYALAADNDEIYAGGYMIGPYGLSATPTYTGGTYSGNNEGFVAEFYDNGSAAPTFNWLQWLGGTGSDYIYALSASGDEIYAGGNSNSATSWETPTYTGGAHSGGYEGFVAELYDNAGAAPSFNWRQWLGGTGSNYIYALSASGDEIYAGGLVDNSGSGFETPTYTGGVSSSNYEAFVAELYDNAGSAPTFNWLQWLGGDNYDYIQALAINGDEIYVGGYSNSATSWETPSYTGGAHSGNHEGFVAELQDNALSAPTFNWLQWLGGTNIDYIFALTLSGDEIYAGGVAVSATSWETPTYSGGTYSGSYEGFVVEIYDNAGSAPTFNWRQWLGNSVSYTYIYALAVSGEKIYAGGYSTDTTNFEIPTYTGGTWSGGAEGIVAKISDNASAAPTFNWLQWLGGTGNDYIRAVIVSGEGIYAGGSAANSTSWETPTYSGGTYSGGDELALVKVMDVMPMPATLRGQVKFRGGVKIK